MQSKGFTVLESITAIFILTVGVGAALSLMNQTLATGSVVEQTLIASYLAQEGIEIVRNIRDTNWLQSREPGKNSPWDDGLCSSPPCEWEADASTTTFFDTVDFERCSDNPVSNCRAYTTGTFLNIESATGFYGYGPADVQTKFKRRITIEKPQADEIKIKVEIYWQERGRTHNFTALEYIRNWYEQSVNNLHSTSYKLQERRVYFN